ncbi:hypothetical protein VTJ04DRAFT_9680 [Mycothermus thermophilus]|uniref:uncharacterized protein n=1 Tax=Humicola insolens TaxID=85995 RepID=UPI00374454BF
MRRSAVTVGGALAALLGVQPHGASASVTVRKTGRGPTGYEVDFRYVNATAKSVKIGGGFQPFTDQFHTTGTIHRVNGRFDPWSYQPGDFWVSNPYPQLPEDYPWPYEMQRSNESGHEGEWILTVPLPSGTYTYAFLPDCAYAPNCTIDSGQLVVDPDVPPLQNVPGDALSSNFHVPFDPEFQFTPELNLNFDYALPAPKPCHNRGTVMYVNYTSPGSIHPAPDVHDFVIYLPPGYARNKTKTRKEYPLLYLSHGANGNGGDWENLGRMSHIMDNLIRLGHIPPTVVVAPTFYNLNATYQNNTKYLYGNRTHTVPVPPALLVRENYEKYLFPFVESHFDVCRNASCRAFAGLSMGGVLAYEMLVNATDTFDYFGLFSPATLPPYIGEKDLKKNPALKEKGIFIAYGLYDFVFQWARDLQTALDALEIRYLNRVTPFGSHAWNTWQDELWWFGQKVLWKELPLWKLVGRR